MSQQTSISAVEAIIDYTFDNQELLSRALHAAGSTYGGHDGNRTMAMLGDAVLKLVLLDDLLPTGASRGFIDRTTSEIVSNQNLAEICTSTTIAYYINGIPSQRGEQPPKTRTATIEAILAAVLLDSGKSIESVRSVMAALGLDAPTVRSTG
ncbi:putative RNAse III [Calycina marina]|uniref:RNAse III n=1 Tax=Calycina marina TaxID=1763456 RepID=A0A9P8CFY5_9HELO|nr:putative RNAse III [Calycina marina]